MWFTPEILLMEELVCAEKSSAMSQGRKQFE